MKKIVELKIEETKAVVGGLSAARHVPGFGPPPKTGDWKSKEVAKT